MTQYSMTIVAKNKLQRFVEKANENLFPQILRVYHRIIFNVRLSQYNLVNVHFRNGQN